MVNSIYTLYREPIYIINSNLDPPVLTYNPRFKIWRLEHQYRYDDDGFIIYVPEGFEFDLASVPRSAWWAIAPFELSIVAPLIHDILYMYGGNLPLRFVSPYRTYTRRETDQLFLEIMRREGIAEWRCRIAYNAVRTFGRSRWRGKVEKVEEQSLQLLPV